MTSFITRKVFWWVCAGLVGAFALSIGTRGTRSAGLGFAGLFVAFSFLFDRIFAHRAQGSAAMQARLKEEVRQILSEQKLKSVDIETVMKELDSCFERAGWRYAWPAIFVALTGLMLWFTIAGNVLAIWITLPVVGALWAYLFWHTERRFKRLVQTLDHRVAASTH